jgi:pantoate--beta-alanine ligase
MAIDLCLDTDVVGCPTVREPDGLAMSSRNVYLNADERKRATSLYRALSAAQRTIDAGETNSPAISRVMADVITADGLALDYAVAVDVHSLDALDVVDREARALVAARLGSVRLIDNAPLIPPS